jgi:hypothetical protein
MAVIVKDPVFFGLYRDFFSYICRSSAVAARIL